MRFPIPLIRIICNLLLVVGCVHGVALNLTALQQIPKEDRQLLSDFFRGLLSQGPFSMTLFGQKSATSFDYPPQLVPLMTDESFKLKFLLESRGWKIWEKYQPLFDFPSFCFLKIDREFLSVLFVHKEKMAAVLEEHREFFQSHFNRDPLNESVDAFLYSAFLPNFDSKNYHLAQGLLLGYQKDSCFSFQYRSRIEDTLAYFPYDVSEPSMSCSAAPDSLLDGYPEDLLKKQSQFKENFSLKRHWPHSNPFFCTYSPGHMAFNIPYDPQLQEIKQEISQLYNSDQFLEDFVTVLSR